MKRKYKLTGCARFLIFMLIFIPAVWVGVTIYQGGNPLDTVRNVLNIEQVDQSDNDGNSQVSEMNILKQELQNLQT